MGLAQQGSSVAIVGVVGEDSEGAWHERTRTGWMSASSSSVAVRRSSSTMSMSLRVVAYWRMFARHDEPNPERAEIGVVWYALEYT
jgi:bifunctional ADP-heptose synthase (sugar kinase/adenylyltransferase)